MFCRFIYVVIYDKVFFFEIGVFVLFGNIIVCLYIVVIKVFSVLIFRVRRVKIVIYFGKCDIIIIKI